MTSVYPQNSALEILPLQNVVNRVVNITTDFCWFIQFGVFWKVPVTVVPSPVCHPRLLVGPVSVDPGADKQRHDPLDGLRAEGSIRGNTATFRKMGIEKFLKLGFWEIV